MTKKLKIRFVKFERALAMQILEQEGKFKSRQTSPTARNVGGSLTSTNTACAAQTRALTMR